METPLVKPPLERASAAESEGRFDAAIGAYGEAIRAAPSSPAAYVNLAALLGSLGRFEEALPVCRRAVEVAPRSIAAQLNLASTLSELRRLDEAVDSFVQALRLAPNDEALWLDLADCLVLAGRVPEAVRILRQTLERKPHALSVRSSLLFALNFGCESASELAAEHRSFNAVFAAPTASSAARSSSSATRSAPSRIRLAFVSGDLHRHSVAYFLAPLLDRYDRTRFHVTCYATGRVVDNVTGWLRSRTDAWIGSHGSTDEALDQRIRQDDIDILVDLGGHTASGRPMLFARRPAPVQIEFLGYPTTTGLAAVGYRISDRLVDPPDAHAIGPERLLRMPHSYFCYRPPPDAPAVAALPLSQTGTVTFGSFNSLPKITDRTLALWSAVLTAVPDARLLIKGQGLSVPAAAARMLARCSSAGIDPERIELQDWRQDVRSHLDLYGRVDIALDTFPYNGATTTCEALWMGVPVVSLSGETHASRMGLSILRAAGRGEWAVRDAQSFVSTCVALASDPRRLGEERLSLRSTLAASALLDETSYVRAFEGLLRDCVAHD